MMEKENNSAAAVGSVESIALTGLAAAMPLQPVTVRSTRMQILMIVWETAPAFWTDKASTNQSLVLTASDGVGVMQCCMIDP